jgi:hypothetical protein
MNIGSARVSTREQILDFQMDVLTEASGRLPILQI